MTFQVHLPVDCVLGHWQSWGACNACGGERTRRRQVLTFPKNGGRECPKAEPWPRIIDASGMVTRGHILLLL